MRPQSGERLPDDVEEHSHRNRYVPPGLEREAWGPRVEPRRGVSIPPDISPLIRSWGTQSSPALISSLDFGTSEKVS